MDIYIINMKCIKTAAFAPIWYSCSLQTPWHTSRSWSKTGFCELEPSSGTC